MPEPNHASAAPDSIVLYGAEWCPDCRRSKAFLRDQRIEYTYVDLEAHPDEVASVLEYNDGKQIIPTIVFPDGSHLAEPSNEELAEKLGLTREAAGNTYDVVIVGGGPTGLTTAIYAAREDLSTLVVEKSALGGQAGITERLDNYPGFPEGIEGAELADRIARQAARYGVELLSAVAVSRITPRDGAATVVLSTGQEVSAGAVVIATGSQYRRTNAPGESDLIGAGVHFCATCDGPFYKGARDVTVLGELGKEQAFLESGDLANQSHRPCCDGPEFGYFADSIQCRRRRPAHLDNSRRSGWRGVRAPDRCGLRLHRFGSQHRMAQWNARSR